jgi:hypothetical protein
VEQFRAIYARGGTVPDDLQQVIRKRRLGGIRLIDRPRVV